MYWLYVILFVCTLIVPGFVGQGWLPMIANREVTEIVFIFIFTTLAFALYIIRDYQFLRYEREGKERKKEVTRLTKDLALSYSYIGEANRRFEILQEITSKLPEALGEEQSIGEAIYTDVLRAISIFSGCTDFVVVVVSQEGLMNHAEIFLPDSALKTIPDRIHIQRSIHDTSQFTECGGEYCIVKASGHIDGFLCLGVFKKGALREDVVDLVRPLLIQVLFLYVYLKNIRNLLNLEKRGKIEKEIES